jgi:thiol-disulfide isomerase/thioredoxin
MKYFLAVFALLIAFSFCSTKPKENFFTHTITNSEVALSEMSKDSAYTVFYCWTDWCGPCLSSMKSTLLKTKKTTDSLGIPIKYNAILYSLSVKEKSMNLMKKAYENGIEVFHKTSPNALTQKLAISSDFKHYEGFEKKFMVPRILLVNKEGKLLSSFFPLNYQSIPFLKSMKTQFPAYFKD